MADARGESPSSLSSRVLRTSWQAPLAGYAAALGVSVVLGLLLVVSGVMESGVSDSGADPDVGSGVNLLAVPFQLVAMALLGSLTISVADASASLFLVPLVLTASFVLVTARVARRQERAAPLPDDQGRLLAAGVAGGAFALLVSLVTWLLALRAAGDTVHAVTPGLLAGSLVLTAGSVWIGRSSVHGHPWLRRLGAEPLAAARLWALHLAVFLVLALVLAFVVTLVEGGITAALSVPLWGPTAGLFAYAVGHLGGVGGRGDLYSVLDMGPGGVILVSVVVLLGLVTALAWHLRRDTRQDWLGSATSWRSLPGAFAAGGLVVWLLPSVVASGSIAWFADSLTLRPAFWVVLLLGGWGLAIEMVSRTLAPRVVGVLPAPVTRVLRGRSPVVPDSDRPLPAPAPMTPQQRARARRLAAIGGSALGALVLLAVVVTVVNSRWFGPERAARDYLDAVTDGDLTSAARQAPAAGEGSTALLTDDVYGAAEGTASGYELGDLTEWDEDKAVLAVELEGVERGAEQELMLERDGRRWLLFDRWRVSDGGLARLVSLPRGEAEGGLTVNGVPVADDAEEFWMLPGTYRVELHARNRWVEEDAAPLVVGDELGSFFEPGEVSASAELRSTVEAELAAYLEQCMSSTEAEPEGCPQRAYPFGDVRRLSWSLVTAPTLDYSWFDGTFPVELSVDEPGTAEASYEVDQSFGFGPRDWQRETEESTLYVEATADVSGDELEVTFDSF